MFSGLAIIVFILLYAAYMKDWWGIPGYAWDKHKKGVVIV